MILWLMLLMAMLQGPTEMSSDAVPARQTEFPGVSVESVPLNELRERIADNDYVPVPHSQLKNLLLKDRTGVPVTKPLPKIREARYTARLNGTRLDQGRLELDIYTESRATDAGPLLIGQTNLQQLKISDSQGSIDLGSDSLRRLFLLKPGCPENLTGSWNSDGMVTGDVVSFRLELPAATTTRFELVTSPRIRVTSIGSLVLGPDKVPDQESGGDLSKWTILPGEAARLSFSCREQQLLRSQDPMPLASFKSAHVLSGDIVSSRWTIGLPSELNGRARITARLSSRVRVADVLLEDKRPVEWQVKEENGQQLLNMLLPEDSDSTMLNVSAASVLPQTETWDIPMLTPAQWSSRDGEQRGPVLMPIGQISVLLPGSVDLDEWTLVGIQERDIVTTPDQSREYQLTQFLPEASAIARTSTSEPRLSDSVATLVEPAGRLATVRCLVNVRCEGASVVELQWPVSKGWQVIAARYASNSRALFFEFPPGDPESATGPLTLHLPESLEPGASRVVEIQFRQSDASDARTINLPLGENRRMTRSDAVVIFPKAFTLSTELQRRWSAGRRALDVEEVRSLMAWLPASRLENGTQCYAVGGSDSTGLAVAAAVPPHRDAIELEHAVRIVEGQIVETSRIVFPHDESLGESLTLLTPSGSANDVRWSIDGEAVPARREVSEEDPQDWQQWMLSLSGPRSGSSIVLRCESRQSASESLVATIPLPASELPIHGTLLLYSSDEGRITAPGLTPSGGDNAESASPINQATSWKLPSQPEAVTLLLGHNPKIQFGQTIDVHMLHMIDEQSGGLHQQVLAVANVSRSAGQNSLPLALSADIRPLVLVNGHRVHLQETKTGFAIPLPLTSVDCQVLLAWSEPAARPDNVTGDRELPRLFLRELSVPQCTHQLLVSPQLELQAPATNFAAADSTDVMRILNRLLSASESSGEDSGRIPAVTVPAEIRSFISQWQLATSLGWRQCTLIDTVDSDLPILVHVTQLRRHLAIAVGMVFLIVAACVACRNLVLEYRLPLGVLACGMLGIHFLLAISIGEAMLHGAFWGLLCGLAFVSASRWSWLRTFRRWCLAKSPAAVILGMTVTTTAVAQQPADSVATLAVSSALQQSTKVPDVLLPETPLPDGDLAYVHRAVLEEWRQKLAVGKETEFAAVVTSLQTEVVAESAESVELLLKLEVAAVSGDDLCHLRIPLQGSRLVECTIDGNQILPEPDGPNAILIPVPPSSLLPAHARDNLAASIRSAEAVPGAEDQDPGIIDTQVIAAVDAGPLAAFTLHHIECRLRPVTKRQKSGLQFRLPTLPCPVAELKVTSPPDLFSRARAQSPAGVLQFNPHDGAIQLNSLAMSEGIDMRLFHSGIDKGSPQLATVEMLMIAELVAEQPVLSCFCRFSRWNPLTPEIRFHIPQSYQLVSVNSVIGGDLLWSVQDRIATILLPNNVGNEFVVSLQLRSTTSSPLQQRVIPIAELIQFADCIVSPNLILAVRANPVFSVLPIEGPQVITLAYADVQSAWGQWLSRSDSVFTVPSGLPEAVIRLAARRSLNEVRISQSVILQNQRIDWKCQVDIDTSVLPVFRHRLTVSSDIEIIDVEVVAGEANRLASWHRRGDRLVVQLREGTTGRHILKISGRKLLRPDDTQIVLHSPHMQDAPLESVLELTDRDGLGLAFEKLGGAVPDEPVAVGDPLQPGKMIRMQIVHESDPIILQRLRPVEPVGSVAVLRFADHVAFVARLTQWSGSLGPLEMKFADGTEFLMDPSVLVDGRQLPLVNEANDFLAGPEVVRELFDQPDFTIVWSMPIPESQQDQELLSFAWPGISDRIQWDEQLLLPLDTLSASGSANSSGSSLPEWLNDSSAIGFGQDLVSQKARVINDVVQLSATEGQLTIPAGSVEQVSNSDPARGLFAVSNSTLWSNPNQSAVGQTTLIVFTALTPGRCSLRIPAGTVVTELDTTEAIRWEDADRGKATVELTKRVTVIQIRWMTGRAESGFASTTLQFAVPFPVDCETHRLVTVASSEGELPQFQKELQTVTAAGVEAIERDDLATGRFRTEPDDSYGGASADLMPDAESLLKQLRSSHQEFIAGFTDIPSASVAVATCRPKGDFSIRVFSRKRLRWPTVVSITAGFLAVAGAAFGQTMRSVISEQTSRIATQSSDYQRSGSKLQTSEGDLPPAGESTSANKAGPR